MHPNRTASNDTAKTLRIQIFSKPAFIKAFMFMPHFSLDKIYFSEK